MSIDATQRDATNNQSTIDILRKNLFLREQRFQKAILANGIAEAPLTTGMLVIRDVATGKINLTDDTAANLANVIGITYVDPKTLAANEELEVSYAVQGHVDENLLNLPGAATLDTTVSGKNLRDILTGLGFVLYNVTENTNFDN